MRVCDVTVVIATHNRPQVLGAAVRSALAQSLAPRNVLVVGDRCDARTEEVLRSLDDPRVGYVNLTTRVGEQSGPNSVGMALAETRYTALLNHDDLWLPDHLEVALTSLESESADLFVGQGATARCSVHDGGEGRIPVFSGKSPSGRVATDTFDGGRLYFEPCSTWVFRTDAARSVGHWRKALEIYRTPLEDWVLRCWRAGFLFAFGDRITVIRVATHNTKREDRGNYAIDSSEHSWVESKLLTRPSEEILAFLLEEIAINDEKKDGKRKVLGTRGPAQRLLYRLLANAVTRGLYARTGLDATSLYGLLTRKRKGACLSVALWRRTRDELAESPDVEELLSSLTTILPDTVPAGR